MKSFFSETQLGIDTLYQLVRDSAYFLCIAEKHQYSVRNITAYPQIEATYQQTVVDSQLNYNSPIW